MASSTGSISGELPDPLSGVTSELKTVEAAVQDLTAVTNEVSTVAGEVQQEIQTVTTATAPIVADVTEEVQDAKDIAATPEVHGAIAEVEKIGHEIVTAVEEVVAKVEELAHPHFPSSSDMAKAQLGVKAS